MLVSLYLKCTATLLYDTKECQSYLWSPLVQANQKSFFCQTALNQYRVRKAFFAGVPIVHAIVPAEHQMIDSSTRARQ